MSRRAAASEAVWALGTMSGTSLDGLDAAMVLTDGHRIFDFGRTAYRAYSPAERATIRAAFGRWSDDDISAAAAEVVETAHAKLLADFTEAKLIGFHGQTVAHDPRGRGTRQLGSGDVLSEILGLPVVWDFRTADVELGGEGAPLAPFFHFAALRFAGITRPVGVLNLGGVGNLTWVSPDAKDPAEEGALLAFDTGPANAPINDLVEMRTGAAWDMGGALAAAGTIDQALVARVLTGSYFARIPPKSLDRDDFASVLEDVRGLSDADAAATLTAIAAGAVARGLIHCPGRPEQLFVAGGGRHNPVMMALIGAATGIEPQPVDAIGLDGDMFEAQAFAHLAVRVARGLPTSAPGTTGVAATVGGGRIAGQGVRSLFD